MKRTPLIENHRKAGAKLVDFAGWEMPIQYSGVLDEYHAVRTAAGLFVEQGGMELALVLAAGVAAVAVAGAGRYSIDHVLFGRRSGRLAVLA